MNDYIVQIDGLNKSFGKVQVLKDISFKMRIGEIYGLIGQNGAGKTTFIRTLIGLINESSGSIRIQNTKKYLGYMPQSCRFDGNATVTATLKFFSDLRKAPLENSLQLCNKLELEASKRVKFLSPGQQKKLQMIIAMTGDPDFYILDEPTAGLDPVATDEMLKYIRTLHERGKSILISSHILENMEDICTNVAIMEKGRLIYDRQLESCLIIKTSVLTNQIVEELKIKYQAEIEEDAQSILVRADENLVANIIKELTQAGISVLGVKESGIRNIVNKNIRKETSLG